MTTKTRCKVCQSPSREVIEQQLRAGVSHKKIMATAKERGETLYSVNLNAHKPHAAFNDPDADGIELLIDELKQEASRAAPSVASLYHVIVKQLRQLDNIRPSGDNLVRAAQAIHTVEGLRSQQQLLLAYMERAFASGNDPYQVLGPPTTEVMQLPPVDADVSPEDET